MVNLASETALPTASLTDWRSSEEISARGNLSADVTPMSSRNGTMKPRILTMLITALIQVPLNAQDVFSAGGADRCNSAREAEKRRNLDVRTELEKEQIDSRGRYQQDVNSCAGDDACKRRATEAMAQRDRAIANKGIAEESTHQKNLLDINNGRCTAESAPQYEQNVLPELADFMRKSEALLPKIGELLEKKLLPDPSSFNPTPINQTFIGKLLFLKYTPALKDWLVSQYNDKARKIEALRKLKKLTPAQQNELNNLAKEANNARLAIRQLRVSYDLVKTELGLEAYEFPDSSTLNFPF